MVYFQTKNPNLGKFWSALDLKCRYILWTSVIFYGHLGYSMTIWYSLCSFGTFFRFGYHVARKNLATLCYLSRSLQDNGPTFLVISPIFQKQSLPLKKTSAFSRNRAEP
jgi:hypothetical protein